MPESNPTLRQEHAEGSSLPHRIVDNLCPRSSPRLSSDPGFNDTGGLGTQGLGITSANAPDVRTRLLESYDRSDPVCGERRCSHGTFSPRVESADRQSFLGGTSGRLRYTGAGDVGSPSSPFRGGDDPPDSRAGSEYTSPMKSSGLLPNEHKKLYALYPVAHLHPAQITNIDQVHILLHPLLHLDQTIPLVFSTRRFDCCRDGLLNLHPHGPVVGRQFGPYASRQWFVFICGPSSGICNLG